VRTLGSSAYRSGWPWLIGVWLGGSALVALIAWTCLRLQLQLATTGFCLLIAIVMLSLLDSFISSVVFSLGGALLLNVLFTPPVYSFAIGKAADLAPLAAFLLTSIAVTSLVRSIRRSEQTQREQARLFLAEAQRLSNTGSFGWNVETAEVVWSEQAFHIFEQDASVAPTIDRVQAAAHPDDRPVLDAMIARVVAGSERFDVGFRLLFPPERVKYLRIVGHAVDGERGGRQIVGAVMDVTCARLTETRLRKLESDIARASRVAVLAQLSASIAHEVGQPLTAAIVNGDACLAWLRRTPLDHAEVERLVRRMREDASRAADIVRRVRRLMTGTPLETAPIDIDSLLQEVLTLLRADIETQGCRVSVNLARDVPRVSGDRVQLQQVLVNLVTNAVQAMAPLPGRHDLLISATRTDAGLVMLSVKDSGPGIDEESLPHLFDAFFTTHANGMGLGLAICASIVEAHGGRLWAVNDPDGGATFSLTLKPV
jgi:C4-dicarboxylate-specific signal transduction histidine kinase